MFDKVIGSKIKNKREELGLSQLQVSKYTFTNQPNINRIESGKTKLTLKRAYQICLILGISLDTLVAGTDPFDYQLDSISKEDIEQ